MSSRVALGTEDLRTVNAFYTALCYEAVVLLAIVAIALMWRRLLPSLRRRNPWTGEPGPRTRWTSPSTGPEPVPRHFLRISFGVLWLFDGLLQAQPSMPLEMTRQVVEPAAGASPAWVQQVAKDLMGTWAHHPVAAATAAVWAQVGLGIWMLTVSRGPWSRLAGVASAGWGLGIWVFGEAFGGIFAPGLTWLSGAPGAVAYYCVAGALIALPSRSWADPHLGRWLLRGIGAFWLGMALLQAWPGRGYWQGQGRLGNPPGSLTSLVHQAAETSQPHFLSAWISAFGNFDAAHGWGVNLFAVAALGLTGAAFVTGRARTVKCALVFSAALCLADWVLVEDLGFLGGVGTDPNSMVPILLLLGAGYLSTRRSPGASSEPSAAKERRALNSPTAASFRGGSDLAVDAGSFHGFGPGVHP